MKDYSICPTITAEDLKDFQKQIDQVEAFAPRIHVDLMDGSFAPTKSPSIDLISIPHNLRVDYHLMLEDPKLYLDSLISLKPNLVIFHIESNLDFPKILSKLKTNNIPSGIAVLPSTEIDSEKIKIISNFDHLLIFGGALGYQGGQIDLTNVSKIKKIRNILPNIEIGWDGGINDINIKSLFKQGVRVFNVGSFIQFSRNPEEQYQKLNNLLEEVE